MTDRTPTADLAQVIADAREEAAILHANGAAFSVDRVKALLRDVELAAEEWLLWLSETDAAVRSGYSVGWLRGRFAGWQREGHARINGRVRQYRACIVPRRADTGAAAVAGRAAARQARKAS